MKSRKVGLFLGGFFSFLLIFITFSAISFLVIHRGLVNGHKHLYSGIQADAEKHAVSLATQMGLADPLVATNPQSERYWVTNYNKRIIAMGEPVLQFPMAENGLELFFLADNGKIVSTNNIDRLMGNKEKPGISQDYNTGFFHRATILTRGTGSVRAIPADYPFKYDLLFSEKLLDKYKLVRDTKSAFLLSNVTIFLARFINPALVSPILDATSPVYGKDNKVVGTAHYLVSLLPVYSFIEDYFQDSLKNFAIGSAVIFFLSLLVVVILMVTQGRDDYQVLTAQILADRDSGRIASPNIPKQEALPTSQRSRLLEAGAKKLAEENSSVSSAGETSSALADKGFMNPSRAQGLSEHQAGMQEALSPEEKYNRVAKELADLSDIRHPDMNVLVDKKEKLEKIATRNLTGTKEPISVVIKKEKLFLDAHQNQDAIPDAITIKN